MTETLQLILKRENLSDDFDMELQEIPTAANISYSIFQKIIYKVNEICKNKENFILNVFIEVEPVIYYNKTHIKQSCKVKITSITNFDHECVNEGIIEINL